MAALSLSLAGAAICFVVYGLPGSSEAPDVGWLSILYIVAALIHVAVWPDVRIDLWLTVCIVLWLLVRRGRIRAVGWWRAVRMLLIGTLSWRMASWYPFWTFHGIPLFLVLAGMAVCLNSGLTSGVRSGDFSEYAAIALVYLGLSTWLSLVPSGGVDECCVLFWLMIAVRGVLRQAVLLAAALGLVHNRQMDNA